MVIKNIQKYKAIYLAMKSIYKYNISASTSKQRSHKLLTKHDKILLLNHKFNIKEYTEFDTYFSHLLS